MARRYILTPYYLDRLEAGLLALGAPGWTVNRRQLPSGSPEARIAAAHQPLADLTATTIRDGDLPVSVAGDCLSALGVLAGLQRAGLDPGLVWLDAHGDFNTWQTTPSGFLGGMPLAMAVGRGDLSIALGVGAAPLPEPQVVLSDARDLDSDEETALAGSAVRHLPDVSAVRPELIPDRPLWVHIDVDVIDPTALPAVNYPAPGGPSVEDMCAVLRRLASSGRLVAVSLSAWRPDADASGRSRRTAMALLDAATGDAPAAGR